MIKLKASYRVGRAPDVIFLMNELRVHRIELEYDSLIARLEAGLDPSTLSDENELEQLATLSSLGVLCVEWPKHQELINFMEYSGWNSAYTLEQLEYMRVKVIDNHPDPFYSKALETALARYDLISDKPMLTIYVVDYLTKLEIVSYPALIVKVGSYRPSVGPVLNQNLLPVEAFNAFINQSKAFFEREGFLAQLPPHLRDLQVALVTHEVLMLLLKVSNHHASSGIVDWDLSTMERNTWRA